MKIRIGTAGWHYEDWYSIVYPERPSKTFKELDYIARFMDTAEINSTFYRPANNFMGSAWVRKVAHNPDFKFTAKLWQRFTHDRRAFQSDQVKQYLDGIIPLASADKLGAVLCQFPWSFKNDETGRKWLNTLIETFKECILVMELRHSSWDTPSVYDFLDKKNVGLASIDQPVIGKSIPFKPIQTGTVGYVRMHGRNYKHWFGNKQNPSKTKIPSSRYDYLYSQDEIKEISETVNTVAKDAKETFVIQNNHPWGQAVANALQLKAVLGESDILFPATMLNRYPYLKKIGKPADLTDTTGSSE
jgi:uncharacterized protein YecE (DUF72 family)